MPVVDTPSGSDTYSQCLAIASYILGRELATFDGNDERRAKKFEVLEIKRKALSDAYPSLKDRIADGRQVLNELVSELDHSGQTTLLIDLSFSDPFVPYELRYRQSHFGRGLASVAVAAGLEAGDAKKILKARKEALNAHRHLNYRKLATYGLFGAAALGAGGWLAAPVVGGMLGSAAGLSGIAAISHGLALLGGGSLAMGGLGMAGGMYLVTGTAAALGAGALGGGSLLLQLGAAGASVELAKLQVSYREVLLQDQVHQKKAQKVVASLVADQEEIKQILERERALNDDNAKRIVEMEKTLEALERSIEWMRDQTPAAS